MDAISSAVITGLIVGAGGTGLGAIITFFIKTNSKQLSAILMGLSGGILCATFFFDMLPESLDSAGLITVLLGLACGAFILYLITVFVPHKDVAELDAEGVSSLKSNTLLRTGVLLAIGIAMHNLPQGVAIGGGMVSGASFSLPLLLLLHNVPEGMAMAIPLKVGNVKKSTIMLIAMAAALPTALGALIGAATAGVSDLLIGVSIAIAGGAMLYLTFKELIPQAWNMHKSYSTLLSIAAGVAIGGVVVWLLH